MKEDFDKIKKVTSLPPLRLYNNHVKKERRSIN